MSDADAIRTFALSMPGAWEDHPWGDTTIKVGKKVFLFIGLDEDGSFGLSVKLPVSMLDALTMPNCSPTHYGLGKHGWVSAHFDPGATLPVRLLEDWILESYRAVALKKFIKELDARGGR